MKASAGAGFGECEEPWICEALRASEALAGHRPKTGPRAEGRAPSVEWAPPLNGVAKLRPATHERRDPPLPLWAQQVPS